MDLAEALRRHAWSGTPVHVVRLWGLLRSKRIVTCELYTHPDGWELRLAGRHDFPRRRVCSTPEAVQATQAEWYATLERDGWSHRPGSL